MKKLLMLTLILSSFNVFACKPAPMEECTDRKISVDQKSFAQLLKNIKKYQAQMDRVIKYPQNRSSCFNNHFANHYGDLLTEELKKYNGKSCNQNILIVEKSFKALIDTDSVEFKSIPKGGQDFFEDEADKLEDQIKAFFKSLKK